MTTVLNSGFRRVTTDATENGDGILDHEELSFKGANKIKITEPGYVFIYLSNENPTPVEVYFDDFKVEHVKSPVVQTEDYYPFGLTFNSYQRENKLTNDVTFQNQERQGELALDWVQFKWRNAMPEIGRFFNVDPLSEDYYYNSVYAFSENKVTSHVELEGLESSYGPLNQEIKKVEAVWRTIADNVKEATETVVDFILFIDEISKEPEGKDKPPAEGLGVNIYDDSEGKAGADNKYLPQPGATTEPVNMEKSFFDGLKVGGKSLTSPSAPGHVGDVAERMAKGTENAVTAEQSGEKAFGGDTKDSTIVLMPANKNQTRRVATSKETGQSKTTVINKPMDQVNY